MRHLILVTVTTTALLLSGCGEPVADGPGDGPGDALPGSWELVEGRGPDGPVPLVDGHPITFDVEADGEQIGGTAACNSYGGQIERDGDQITVSELFATEMACSPAEVMDSEQAYLTALPRADTAVVEGDRLVLSGDEVELTYDRRPDPVDAALVGTTWVLDTLLDADMASSVPEADRPITLELAEGGTYEAYTGCNDLNGEFLDVGPRFDFTTVAVTDVACPDADLGDVQDHVLAVLDSEVEAEVDGGRLTLTAPDGLGLSYRAEE